MPNAGATVADALEHLLDRVGERVEGEHRELRSKIAELRGSEKPQESWTDEQKAAYDARPAAVSDERGTPEDRVAAAKAELAAAQARLDAATAAAGGTPAGTVPVGVSDQPQTPENPFGS